MHLQQSDIFLFAKSARVMMVDDVHAGAYIMCHCQQVNAVPVQDDILQCLLSLPPSFFCGFLTGISACLPVLTRWTYHRFDKFDATMMETASRTCNTCTYLMMSESSETGMRCGYTYFVLPPISRKAQRMSSFKQVMPTDTCSRWEQHSSAILRDRFS